MVVVVVVVVVSARQAGSLTVSERRSGSGTTESAPSGIQPSLSGGGDNTVLAEHPVPDAVRPLARFYMTSDLRATTGLTRTHLDFYLREGIIVPTARTESGYLLFDQNELSTLRQVIAWRQDGVGIRDIRARLARGEDVSISSLPSD